MTIPSSGQPAAPHTPVGPPWNLLATTDTPGFALQNGTPNIISAVLPNTGQLHRVMFLFDGHVLSTETGGQVVANYNTPDGGAVVQPVLNAGGQGVGGFQGSAVGLVADGATVTIKQGSALSAGSATVWCEIWGS